MVKASQQELEKYKKLQKKYTPPRPWFRNAIQAFLIGGAISMAGEAVRQFFIFGMGMSPKTAGPPTSSVMIFLGALLTGIGIYDQIGRVGGMGAALPITGFSNSIVSPAMEFKREGWVMGVGARMFTVAGPVIVYGLLTAFAVGFVQFALTGGKG